MKPPSTDLSKQAVYQLNDIRKTYNGRTVLAVDELEIYRGEIFSLVGPSGSGKSTLLRLLNFLEHPSQGDLRFAGQQIPLGQEAPLDLRRRVTTVFQRPMLLNRSVQDNVAFGLRLRGNRNAHLSVESALDEVGLAHLAQQSARTLSGGEAQRVALARALVIKPEVLLLDEPTANLDPSNVSVIEEIILRLNRERGVTIVLVTHHIFQARRLADRVGLLLEGRLIEAAPNSVFFNSPHDPRTLAFVGGEMIY
jgi:tungstate transport system ATP-binding protein